MSLKTYRNINDENEKTSEDTTEEEGDDLDEDRERTYGVLISVEGFTDNVKIGDLTKKNSNQTYNN